MGSGQWTPATYDDRTAARVAAGRDAFDYSRTAVQSGVLRPHPTLDPKGIGLRESRDSAEHPTSTAVIISLDVTGSMGQVVRGIHANLPQLHELLLGHKYLEHPQVCFAAVGDAFTDKVPFQIGQFESDNRMDQDLEHMVLEGNGGGQNHESYELVLYAAARHTATDCWDKRHRKGYLFIIGDELAYPAARADQVRAVLGGGTESNIPLADLVAEATRRWHVYFVIPGGAEHGHDPALVRFWADLLGRERVLALADPAQTSAAIAVAIGANEGVIDQPPGDAPAAAARGVVAKVIHAVIGACTG
jgi:hypothetical protein